VLLALASAFGRIRRGILAACIAWISCVPSAHAQRPVAPPRRLPPRACASCVALAQVLEIHKAILQQVEDAITRAVNMASSDDIQRLNPARDAFRKPSRTCRGRSMAA
jgi:hypothetical protein